MHSKLGDRVASPLDIVNEAKAFVTWEQSSGFGALKSGRSCKKLPALHHLRNPLEKAPRVPDSTSNYLSAPTIKFPRHPKWSSPSNWYHPPPHTAPPRMPSGCVYALREDSWPRPKSSDPVDAGIGRCPGSQSSSSCPRIKGEKSTKHASNRSVSSRCLPDQQLRDSVDMGAPSPIVLRIDLPTRGKRAIMSTPTSWESHTWDFSPPNDLCCVVEDSAEPHHVRSKRLPRREGSRQGKQLEAVFLTTEAAARHGANDHTRKSDKSRKKKLERKSSKSKLCRLDAKNADDAPHQAIADELSAKRKLRHADNSSTERKARRADSAHGRDDIGVLEGGKPHVVHAAQCVDENANAGNDHHGGAHWTHKSYCMSDDSVKRTEHQRSGSCDVLLIEGEALVGGGAPPAPLRPNEGNHPQENDVQADVLTVRSEDDLDADYMVTDTMVCHSVGRVYVGKHRKWVRGEMLGMGTLGIVFKAMDSETGETFAVKEVSIDDKLESDVKFSEALQREIDMLKDLKHDHIVSYLGHDTINAKLYIYLEYMVGGSIAHVVSNFGALDEGTMATYTKHVLLGLEFLHSQDPPFLHRDIKGANVLVGIDCKAKLSDFGCSKRATDCMARTMAGSILWMAPEVMNGVGYGRKADLWSLGCLVVEMSSARHPWESFDNNVVAMVRIAMSGDIPAIPEHVSSVCKDFILACLTRDPDERPSASELLRHPFVAEAPD